MMLCSSKCNVFEDFEASMNIIYLIAKNVAIEKKKIEVVIFKDSMNEDILKLPDSEMIIILMKIVWQQKMKTTTNKLNKLSNEASEKDDVNSENCFLQQQCE